MIQLLALGNNGMNGSGKSAGKEEEASLAFDALLQLTSGQDLEKEKGDKQYTLVNQFVQPVPIIQSYRPPFDEPTANILNESASSILSFSQPASELFVLQQAEMKTANPINPLTATLFQSSEQDPVPSNLPLGQQGTSSNQAEALKGSFLQQFAQRDVLGKDTVEKQTVLSPSLVEQDPESNQKELPGIEPMSGDSPDTANTVNPGFNKINFSTMPTTDSQVNPVLANPIQASNFNQDVSLFLKSTLNVQQSEDGIQATFTLAPEHLGKVDVKVSIKDGHVTAEFLASTPTGKDLLETHVQALRTALETQGLQVDKINISQQNTTSFMGTFSQKGDSNTRQGQQDSKKRNDRIVHEQEKEYRDIGLDTGWVSQINTTA